MVPVCFLIKIRVLHQKQMGIINTYLEHGYSPFALST